MNHNAFSVRGRFGTGALAGLLLLAALPSLAGAQSVEEKYQLAKRRASAFNLTSGPTAVLQVNKFQCGLINNGSTCTDVFNSPTGGGGFWPTGTPDQYMFNSGIQVVGIIPASANFPWAGDTVGAFFMDATGSRQHGTAVTQIYNSLDADDLANWPDKGAFPDFPDASAWVTDTNLFNDVLIGRKAASQQDSWVMYWDGDPGPSGGRVHPMGILVEQRTLAWNYPAGNEAIIYFIYKFTNVTNNPLFQRLNETQFFGGANMLPDGGWRVDSVYVAYDSDPDVTADFNKNYATGILPFNLGLAYEGTFFEPAFDYPPSEFFPPFFTAAPGLMGIKYLKSPVDPLTGEEVGLTSLSLHTNGGAFHDPSDVKQGWRYISLNVDAGKGDPQCTFALSEVKQRRACYLGQNQSDVRFFIGSGPFSLDPGQSATVAVAMYAAATVNTPLITPSNSADNKPGFPGLKPGCPGDPLRPIDVAAGWIRTNVCPTGANESVDQHDVDVVPGSLLGKALVAQAIFDNKFLLGFAPETPNFYLVPGDNQVTVVWEPSRTEQDGDPFFSAAGDPASPLYDPNYREKDVEGYRIYRGTTPANLTMIAQFDKKGSTFTDNLCVTDPTFVTGEPCDEVHEVDLTGAFVQYPAGGVVELADGSKLVVKADTALSALVSIGAARQLEDTGVPYAFIDKQVRNGFPYFYKVTAFDINSLKSGPSSLESAGPPKNATPRANSSTLADPAFEVSVVGRGTTPLSGSAPTINPTTGVFSGPAAPTTQVSADFVAFASQLLPAGTKEIRIDSVTGGYYPNGSIGTWYLNVDGVKTSFEFSNGNVNGGEGDDETVELPVIAVPADPSIRQQLVAKGIDAPASSGSLTSTMTSSLPHFHSGDSDWAFKQPGFWSPTDPPAAGTGTLPGGSRWFTGANETVADPTAGFSAGEIQGYTILKPNPYQQTTAGNVALATYHGQNGDIFRRFYGTTFGVRRAADVKFYWGAAGVDSVIDVTHNVTVPRVGSVAAGYGFLTDADADGTLQYGDFYYMPGFENTGNIGGLSSASPTPLVAQPVVMPVDVTGDLAADGDGFGLYVNGEAYLFLGPRPTSGVWTLRTYDGSVTQNAAGTYSFAPTAGVPAIPGLRILLNVQSPSVITPDIADLSRVHTVPDPYYAVSQYDLGPSSKELKFVNLPAQATIRIYSMSGILVDILNHDDATGGGAAPWDLRNRSGQFVASGVYLYHVSTPDGKSVIGKFTVVNSGFAR